MMRGAPHLMWPAGENEIVANGAAVTHSAHEPDVDRWYVFAPSTIVSIAQAGRAG